MKHLSIFQWYRVLRMNYQFTKFEAIRAALWLARPSGVRRKFAGCGDSNLDSTRNAAAGA
ncbi:MAG: hypothetical protein ACLPZF_06800 [Candidatus Acidiferrales bacterium]